MNSEDRIAYLEERIAELNARMPKHSIPAAMIIELEDLEDKLDELKKEVERGAD
jgi:HAMP domain-containing protein